MAANKQKYLNVSLPRSPTRSSPAKHAQDRWGIVLSGGEGARMRPLISHWLGEDRPKQYCRFVGERSMFQHTIDRARNIVSEKQVVTIVGRGHRKFINEFSNTALPGIVIEQPSNLGTAPGVFLPTTYVLTENPEATVLILPSDHFIHPKKLFCEHVTKAFELAEKYHDKIILVAAIPDRAETDYGWISPDIKKKDKSDSIPHNIKRVTCFWEKPGDKEARWLFQQGCLWNTMVMVAKAKTLWKLGQLCLPEMICKFNAFIMVLRAIRAGRLASKYEAMALTLLYEELPSADFSKDILQHVSDHSWVLPLHGVDWCDWGRPERVTETLSRLGREPLFQPDHEDMALIPSIVLNGKY